MAIVSKCRIITNENVLKFTTKLVAKTIMKNLFSLLKLFLGKITG